MAAPCLLVGRAGLGLPGLLAYHFPGLAATGRTASKCVPRALAACAGGKRTNWESSGGSRKTLNQLLTDMDGFEENRWEQVEVCGGRLGV
jgi:hypothetical protein